jgi:hypothetical protein
MARDLACILDLDRETRSWCTPGPVLDVRDGGHIPEFKVTDQHGEIAFLDITAPLPSSDQADVEAASRALGASYRLMRREEVYDGGFRLPNARDLLKYAKVTVTLADRVRLLGLLDQEGSLPMSDCLGAIRNSEPVAAIASMILHSFVDVELDEAILGPETMVRRIRG